MSDDHTLRVLLLAGSCAPISHTAANCAHLADRLAAHGALPEVWDLLRQPLPFHNVADHFNPLASAHPAVRALAERAQAADAFVWATPVYHGSFSGLLKNALDNLSMRLARHKPVALIGHGGARSAVQPCDQLRLVARALGAVAIPSQIATTGDDFAEGEAGPVITDDFILQRFERTAVELLAYARALKTMRTGA